LQTAAPGVGADAMALLQSPQPPIAAVLATLLNDLSALQHDIVLVLDDFHTVDARDVLNGMTFLLDHLPPRVHLVIAGRADPVLPLARLRGRGDLIEIRVADLRFTPGEAAAFLNQVMGLELTAGEVTALEGRTEGWIAALQLAALSMQGRDDVAGFIAGFTGDDRYIVDYLVEEVLQRQPDQVRGFLLQTSVLDRMSGPLCDAVTGQDGGKAMLEALERGNLFVVPLDDHRRWYRYHHLFATVLRARLLDEEPSRVPDLHRRASGWYERNGEPAEAIRHAFAAKDFERAAYLLELMAPTLRRNRQEVMLLDWLKALPDAVVRVRPVLSALYGGALLINGEREGVESRLRDAERWLAPTADPSDTPERGDPLAAQMVVVDEEEFRRLPGSIAVWRAGRALAMGNTAETVTYARRALDLLPDDDHLGHGGAAGLLGLVAWASGDLALGHRMYADAMPRLQRAGYIADSLGCAIALADIRIAQGCLHDAMRTYEQALRLAAAQGTPTLRGTADMYAGMSEVWWERGDLPAATQYLLRCQELGEHAGLPQNRYRWRTAMARMRVAEGDFEGALELLHEAERLYVGDFSPDVRPIAARMARVWVAQGRFGDALAWARDHGVSPDDEPSYLREFEHITLARLLLARARGDAANRFVVEAMSLLQRLLRAAEDGGRTGSVIEILILQALALQLQGDIPLALVPLERALTLAGPEGYLRIVVDEGPPMATLLRAAESKEIAPAYIRRLLTAFGAMENDGAAHQDLIEPLSDRELDVLRLLGTDLDGPDIARELVVSLNTMRTHTKNIYSKLGVNNRRAAVRRADELQLVSRTHERSHRPITGHDV
jgi:LuxR family maltose regulon positive regulatory protein